MNLIKKLLSVVVLFVLLINMSVVNAEGNVYKQLILAKNELQNTKGGAKYIKQVDQLVEKYKNDAKVLQKLKSRTDELLIKLENDKTIKKQLILYINAKSEVALVNLQEDNQDELIYDEDDDVINEIEEEIEETKVSDDDIKEMLTSTVSKSDEDKLNTEVVKIQLNLLEKGTKSLEDLTKEFDKLSNYEQKGNFNVNFNLNQKEIGKVDANFKFSDYTSSNSNFDSELKGKIETLVNGAIKGEEEFKVQLSSFIDFISKDGNMYLLLKDLNVSENTVEEIKSNIEKLQEIAKQNKYIKFDDNNSAEAIAILKSLTPSKILSEGKTILSQPMFKAYKKVGDKYYLVPTKYGCDKTKELMNKFDPINGTTCSENQYKDMLKKMVKTGSIYMILGTNNTLGFEGITNNEIEKLEGTITFSDTNIEKINLIVLPNQEKTPNEGLILDYKRNNILNFGLYSNEGNIDYKFNSNLDSNNKFSYIDFVGKNSNSYSNFDINLKLENHQIKGNFNKVSSEYDYKTGKYVKGDITSGEILGSTDYSNKLQDLNISIKGINNENKQFAKANFAYLNNKITFTENYERNGSKIDFLISGTRNSQQKLITDGDFSLSVSTKDRNWDEKTFEYTYSGDYKETVNSKINVINKVINGVTNIKEGNESITITHTGNYDKKYFKLNSNFIISPELYLDTINQSEKARDSVRIIDLNTLKGAIEQSYQDFGEYPTKANIKERLKKYYTNINNLNDPSGNIEINGCKFGYIYEVGNDKNGIKNQKYRISSCLESKTNIEKKAKEDGGIYDDKIEFGTNNKDKDFKEKFYIDGSSTWTKKIEENEIKNVNGNLNFEFDSRDNKGNANVYFDFSLNNEQIIKFELNNTSTIEYKKVEIKEPDEKNTIDSSELEEVFNNY